MRIIIGLVQYLIVITLLLSSHFLVAAEINLSRSKLMQLAKHLEVADQEKQYYFLQIALYEMFERYQEEFNHSLNDFPKTLKGKRDIYRWRNATRAYIKFLDRYLYLIDSGNAINFVISKPELNKPKLDKPELDKPVLDKERLLFIIAGIPIIISGPNSGADKLMEKNIVTQFCSQYDCHEYFAHSYHEEDPGRTISSENIVGKWLFKKHQTAFTLNNGLIFNFSGIKNRINKESWVYDLSDELSLLVDSLMKVEQQGKTIAWSSMAIKELPVTDNAFKVTINKQNDYLKLALPVLGQNPDLFHILIPWLKKQCAGLSTYNMTINDVDQYFSQQ